MKKYDNYKDSGIEWIGKIPSHWIMQRIDWVSKIVRGNTAFKKDELLDAGEYIALQYGKTYKVDVVDDSFNFYVNSEFFNESQVTTKGDTILISTSETVEDLGHTCFYNNQNVGLLGGEQILLKPNRKFLHEKYLYHYSRQFGSELRRYARGLKVFRFNTSDLKQLFIAIPTLKEQISIANFLDHKTSQIDHLIAKKEQFIKLLEEERVAVINQAVTKGLDPNVPMKDSGVEWLGEIPEHWFLVPVKRVIEVRDGTHDTPEYVQNELISFPLITSKDFDGEEINFSNAKMISESDHRAISKRSGVKSGDVLMSMIGGNIGKSLIIGNRDNFSIKNVALFMTRDNIFLAKYLRYYFDSGLLSKQIELKSRGGAQGFLSLGDIRNLIFFKFDSVELKIIIDYLDKTTTDISNVISKTKQEIELLKEYKTALISEVVTGKVDVSTSSTQG